MPSVYTKVTDMSRSTYVPCIRAQCDTNHQGNPAEHYRQLAIEGHAAVQALNVMAGMSRMPAEHGLGMANAAWRAIALLPTVVADLVLEHAIELRFRARSEKELHRARSWEVLYFLNVNDVFDPAADLEPIEHADIDELAMLLRLEPDHGALLWAARKRNRRPMWAFYQSSLPKKLWSQFNAAGPERTDPLGIQPAPAPPKSLRARVKRIIHTYIKRR